MAASPPADAVRAQLDLILASPGFVNADRLSRFLRFVVERTLAGEGDQLKEYLLGTEVFDRPADYDPRLDSIVRVEARRLRSKLAEYYEGPGRLDPIVIRVDKGSYTAAFEAAPAIVAGPAALTGAGPDPVAVPLAVAPADVRTPVAARRRWLPFALATAAVTAAAVLGWNIASRGTASASSRVQVAVLPLARYDTTPEPVPEALADAVTDGLIAELARHPGVEVASRTSVMPFRERRVALSEIASALGVVAVVEGRVGVAGPKLWLEVRVVDARRNRKVWVDDFSGDTANRRELEGRVASALARVLESRFGTGVTVE
jgi:TolB-like protein